MGINNGLINEEQENEDLKFSQRDDFCEVCAKIEAARMDMIIRIAG